MKLFKLYINGDETKILFDSDTIQEAYNEMVKRLQLPEFVSIKTAMGTAVAILDWEGSYEDKYVESIKIFELVRMIETGQR
jgi:hypothetical protein